MSSKNLGILCFYIHFHIDRRNTCLLNVAHSISGLSHLAGWAACTRVPTWPLPSTSPNCLSGWFCTPPLIRMKVDATTPMKHLASKTQSVTTRNCLEIQRLMPFRSARQTFCTMKLQWQRLKQENPSGLKSPWVAVLLNHKKSRPVRRKLAWSLP